MKIGSLFSGIGGLELGLEQSGLGHTVWQVEQNPYCLAVLKKHWPNVERYTDVKEVGSHNLTKVDLICGGFPCQDVSSAGKGAGIAVGTRSGLWFEFRRIIGELRPRFVVVENVASGARRWLPTVRRDLHMLGYDSKALGISARDVGAPHLRRRVFIVAYPDGQWELQSEGSVEELGRRVGDGGKESVFDTNSIGFQDTQERHRSSRFVGGTNTPHNWEWATEPPICGGDNGIPARVDRLRALGNAVVPQCAEIVGKVILDML